jgi:hypothetical protein
VYHVDRPGVVVLVLGGQVEPVEVQNAFTQLVIAEARKSVNRDLVKG